MNLYKIENPRYPTAFRTTVKCSSALNDLVCRNWSRENMYEFDDAIYTRAFNIEHEKMIDDIVSNFQFRKECEELLTRFHDLDARCKHATNELTLIKTERKQVLAEMRRRRTKLNEISM
jgi:hypothetical protein